MPNNRPLRGSLVATAFVLAILAGCAFALAADKTPANGRLLVHVVDASGAPQAAAMVKAFKVDLQFRRFIDIGSELRCDVAARVAFDRLATDEHYLLRATVGDRLVGYSEFVWLDSDKPTKQFDIQISAARQAKIRVRDPNGNPIAGATVVSVGGDTPNGMYWINSPDLQKLGVVAGPTNAAGELALRMLPQGRIYAHLFHPKFAPLATDTLVMAPGKANDAVMPAGVPLELRFRLPNGVSQIDQLCLQMESCPYYILLPTLSASGKINLTVPPGSCSSLSIQQPDFTVTPEYYKIGKRFTLNNTGNVFTFDVRKRTKVRGRIVNESTGKPMAGILLFAHQTAGRVDGPFADVASEWSNVAFAWTDDQGQYELPLSAGPAQFTILKDRMTSEHNPETINVAADGSTVVPDIRMRPTPKVRGIVRDPDGRPVAHAVLRFRDSPEIYYGNPIEADSEGRFELAPQRMPTDWSWKKAQPVQTILAFDPYRPLGAVARVDLSKPKTLENIELRLKPQDFNFPVVGFPDEFANFKARLSADWRAKEAAWARGGAMAPELDGALWLNTSKPKMSLADFRGKYLLLHFWTTWCGNCPKDMQHLVVAERLYRDKGLAVVCVHDNSVPIAEIKQYVAEHKIKFPVVIDQPDGRILAGYKPHGAYGYPSDVLVGPDGRIVGHLPESNRVLFRIELLRQQLMSHPATRHDGP